VEKLILALVYTSRRLRRYFQAHNIVVLTSKPIHQVLRKPETSGRVVKWAIELGAFDVTFKARTSIKGQVLADFLTEVANGETTDSITNAHANDEKDEPWCLYTDGSSNIEGSGAGSYQ
jgi:hypothetical protein